MGSFRARRPLDFREIPRGAYVAVAWFSSSSKRLDLLAASHLCLMAGARAGRRVCSLVSACTRARVGVFLNARRRAPACPPGRVCCAPWVSFFLLIPP